MNNSGHPYQPSFDDFELQDEDSVQQERDAGELLAGKSYSAIVTATDWTVETLISQLRKNNILLDPSFQRRDAWTARRKSEFIESLFLGLPVPQIVLAESKTRKGSYIVLDGKQRLLTLRQFADSSKESGFSQFKPSGLQLRPDLNGRGMADILDDSTLEGDISFFENYTMRTVVLRNWPSEDYLYLVFLRLNSGSLPLSAQELRQVVSPGPFTRYVAEFTAESAVITGLFNAQRKPDFRMRDVELAVRYFGLINLLTEYSGNLKLFLDKTCESLNADWSTEENVIRKQAMGLQSAIEITFSIFGEDAFRKWNGTNFEKRFNRAVFDIMVYYFCMPAVAQALSQTPNHKLVEKFKLLCDQHPQFRTSLESTTKSLTALGTRLEVWGRVINASLNIDVSVPELQPGLGRIV